jgi:hypothetical protein
MRAVVRLLISFESIAAASIILGHQLIASACPKNYIERYEDERATKVGEYWIITVPNDSESDLRMADVQKTFDTVIKQRQPDFKCTFSNPTSTNYSTGRCVNSAGHSWNPGSTSPASPPGEQKGYIIDSQGSYSVSECWGDSCTAVVDKSGKRFLIKHDSFRSVLQFMTNYNQYAHLMLRDVSIDMETEAIVLRPLFEAGEQRYVTISREVENGFYCTYQGGVSPNF